MNNNKIDDLIFRLNGAAMTILNELGHGLREKTYERALCVELDHLDISYNQQKNFKHPKLEWRVVYPKKN